MDPQAQLDLLGHPDLPVIPEDLPAHPVQLVLPEIRVQLEELDQVATPDLLAQLVIRDLLDQLAIQAPLDLPAQQAIPAQWAIPDIRDQKIQSFPHRKAFTPLP